MKYVIFYSWQSDLPNNTNRGFIQGVLDKAINGIQKTGNYELEPSLDRDTMAIPGAPNISQAILEKIKTCDALVADISIVTGNKTLGERPSPNPNVLIELGFAIALLGWDRIILFCNEEHGTDEELPFDIRQHRRINYTLKQEDPKADIRKGLISQFKGRLEELLQEGVINNNVRQPHLSVSWNYITLDPIDYPEGQKGKPFDIVKTDTKILEVKRMKSSAIIKKDLKRKISDAKKIDGGFDPEWGAELAEFIEKSNKFCTEIDNLPDTDERIISLNIEIAMQITLSVENDGTASASDVRIKIQLPDWIVAVEELPDKDNFTELPEMPYPVPASVRSMTKLARMTDVSKFLQHGIGTSPYLDHLLTPRIAKSSACSAKDGQISLWADRLLHKHIVTPDEYDVNLFAKSDAPLGETILKGQAFCNEYLDWEEFEVKVNIVDEDLASS